MPMPAPEFDMFEEPIIIIKEFLKNHQDDAWTPEEISANTGLNITNVYHLCQLIRAKYVEYAVQGEYFPIRAIERGVDEVYFRWVEKPKRRRASRKKVSEETNT